MNIDKNENIFDVLDHNLIELEIITENIKISFTNKWAKTEYISFKENHVEQFLETIKQSFYNKT